MVAPYYDYCRNCTTYLGPHNVMPCPNCGQEPTSEDLQAVQNMYNLPPNQVNRSNTPMRDMRNNPYQFEYSDGRNNNNNNNNGGGDTAGPIVLVVLVIAGILTFPMWGPIIGAVLVGLAGLAAIAFGIFIICGIIAGIMEGINENKK